MQIISLWLVFFLLIFSSLVRFSYSFRIIPLGVNGGLDESNLSSFLLSCGDVYPANSSDPLSLPFLLLDGGSIRSGLSLSVSYALTDFAVTHATTDTLSALLAQRIGAALLTHAHADHINGFVLNAFSFPSNLPVYSSAVTISALQNIFASSCIALDAPAPPTFAYQLVANTTEEILIPNTYFSFIPFFLFHARPTETLSFLLFDHSAGLPLPPALLFLGDFGADIIENSTRDASMWSAIAPYISSEQLYTIILECSWSDSRPSNALFGHLTPSLLMSSEIAKLAETVGQINGKSIQTALKDINLVIYHRIPVSTANTEDPLQLIEQQLTALNIYGLKLFFPTAAVPFTISSSNGALSSLSAPSSPSSSSSSSSLSLSVLLTLLFLVLALVGILAVWLFRQWTAWAKSRRRARDEEFIAQRIRDREFLLRSSSHTFAPGNHRGNSGAARRPHTRTSPQQQYAYQPTTGTTAQSIPTAITTSAVVRHTARMSPSIELRNVADTTNNLHLLPNHSSSSKLVIQESDPASPLVASPAVVVLGSGSGAGVSTPASPKTPLDITEDPAEMRAANASHTIVSAQTHGGGHQPMPPRAPARGGTSTAVTRRAHQAGTKRNPDQSSSGNVNGMQIV